MQNNLTPSRIKALRPLAVTTLSGAAACPSMPYCIKVVGYFRILDEIFK
jgi:hypothetical protein